jgi:hypothetical protein
MLASMAGTPGVDMVAAGSDKLLPFSGGASVTSLPVRLPSWARSRAPIALNPNIVHETPRYSTAAVAFAHAAREEIADAESRLLVRKIGSALSGVLTPYPARAVPTANQAVKD